jgi:hypothetical protein
MLSSSPKTLRDKPQCLAKGDQFRKSIRFATIFNLFHSHSGKLYLSCCKQLGESPRKQYALGSVSFEQHKSSHLNEVTVSFCPSRASI